MIMIAITTECIAVIITSECQSSGDTDVVSLLSVSLGSVAVASLLSRL